MTILHSQNRDQLDHFMNSQTFMGISLLIPPASRRPTALLKPFDTLNSHRGNLYHLTKADFLLFSFIME